MRIIFQSAGMKIFLLSYRVNHHQTSSFQPLLPILCAVTLLAILFIIIVLWPCVSGALVGLVLGCVSLLWLDEDCSQYPLITSILYINLYLDLFLSILFCLIIVTVLTLNSSLSSQSCILAESTISINLLHQFSWMIQSLSNDPLISFQSFR